MPLNLTNLLNSAPVSPPHSHCHNTNTGPSPKELSLLLSPETQANQFINQIKSITPTQPATYNLNKKHLLKSTSYQRPVPITSFSYDQHRRIHTGNNQFLSLSPLLSPPDLIGLNLAHQIDQAIYQDESIDEALDGLLIRYVLYLYFLNKPKLTIKTEKVWWTSWIRQIPKIDWIIVAEFCRLA